MTEPRDPASPHAPVVLGRLSGLYGVRGWLRVYSYTEPRDGLLDYREWLVALDGRWKPMSLAEGRVHGRGLVVSLAGIDNRESAAGLVGADIAVMRDRLPETEPGRYYWSDLVGLTVRHRDGRELGALARMLATGAHDVMVVTPTGGEAGGSREILIPFVLEKFVLEVDLEAGVIDVDWEWDCEQE